jgi:hypothetical protein
MAAQKYWFKARKRGVGWSPSTWQGWTMLALYIVLLIHSFIQIDKSSHSVSDTLISFFPRFLIFTALLTIVTYIKGEPTTWHQEPIKPSEESKKE